MRSVARLIAYFNWPFIQKIPNFTTLSEDFRRTAPQVLTFNTPNDDLNVAWLG